MIYSINQNNKKGIGFTGGNSGGVILKQVLKKTESEIKKPGFQRKKAVYAKSQSKTKGSEPKVWKKTRQDNFRQRT